MPLTFYPSVVEQVSDAPDQEIGWSSFFAANTKFLLNSRWKTLQPLSHLSNPATGDLRNKTWSLVCTGFNIPELSSVVGLELNVSGQRNGRIVDEIIQLTYQGQKIGNNNFVYITDPDGNLPITNQTIYCGPTNFWGTTLTPTQLTDPTFGVVLKFQSHPYYPHLCGMIVDTVSLNIY